MFFSVTVFKRPCLRFSRRGIGGKKSRSDHKNWRLDQVPNGPHFEKKKRGGGGGFNEWTDMFHIRSQNNDGFCSSGSFLSQNPTATTEVNHRLARGWLMALPRSWTGALKSHRSTFQTSNLSRFNLIGLPRDRRRQRRHPEAELNPDKALSSSRKKAVPFLRSNGAANTIDWFSLF